MSNPTQTLDSVLSPSIVTLTRGNAESFFADLDRFGYTVLDTIEAQLQDWAKTQNASVANDRVALNEIVAVEVGEHAPFLSGYGNWVTYPWRKTAVHLLPPSIFRDVRLNRNREKMTLAEQNTLKTKVVGVVGLSVGNSIAVSLVQEGIVGEVRIADFDTLDLSNLNHLRATVLDLGLNKVTLAARQISEIDPYVKVVPYSNGLDEDNMDAFLTEGRPVDVLVEECDTFYVKVRIRERARAFGIPVVMATSDRGLFDVERFDLDPEAPLLGGVLGDLTSDGVRMLTGAEQEAVLFRFLGGRDQITRELRESIGELGKSIVSYPQLTEEINQGVSISLFAIRKILLNQPLKGGRYYVDLEALFARRLDESR